MYGKTSNDAPHLSPVCSRRQALALLYAGLAGIRAASADMKPVRLAISETLIGDVNLNDARAAMLIWIKKMTADLKVEIDLNPRVFDTTAEIVQRTRSGQLDSVALNIAEYRQIADQLDSSQILCGAGIGGKEQYLLLTRRNSGLQHLADLRGRRLCILKAPTLCLAPAWLTTILDDGSLGPSEEFFAAQTTDTKVSRVVLPVFFGQADACITSKRGFDTMCELNPQVGKDLAVIASSSPMVVTFYVFHKNYRSASREIFIKVLSQVRTSAAGQQMATLFQFNELTVRDATCLTDGLTLLERAEHAHKRRVPGGGR